MTDEHGSDRRPPTLGGALVWLVHPVTIAAIVLLLVNDHMLKAAVPGLLSGKLSDVAGLVMAPPVLAVVLAVGLPWLTPNARATVAVAMVGVAFAAVKASSPVAEYASSLWSVVNGPSAVLADETDLVALPALGLAWWTGRACAGVDLGRWARLLGVLVILPTASMAIVATSAPRYDDAVEIVEWRGRLMVGIGNAWHKGAREAEIYRASDDGGLSFRNPPDTNYGEFLEEESTLARAGQRDCSATRPSHCFRVVPRQLRVEETEDSGATWRTAWEVTEAQRARLATGFPELGEVAEYLSSRALVVWEQPDGNFAVLVANGRDGFARRDASGEWSRIGFGMIGGPSFGVTSPPVPIPGFSPSTLPRLAAFQTTLAIVVAAAVICMGLVAAAIRGRRRAIGVVGLASVALGAAPAMIGAARGFLGWILILAGGLAMVLIGLTITVWWALAQRLVTRAGVALIMLMGGAGVIGVLAPHLAWLGAGWPPPRLTSVFAAVAAILATTGSVLLGLRHATHRLDPAPAREP